MPRSRGCGPAGEGKKREGQSRWSKALGGRRGGGADNCLAR